MGVNPENTTPHETRFEAATPQSEPSFRKRPSPRRTRYKHDKPDTSLTMPARGAPTGARSISKRATTVCLHRRVTAEAYNGFKSMSTGRDLALHVWRPENTPALWACKQARQSDRPMNGT